jgi:hypothetical protein
MLASAIIGGHLLKYDLKKINYNVPSLTATIIVKMKIV